jgi:hypothetical protein
LTEEASRLLVHLRELFSQLTMCILKDLLPAYKRADHLAALYVGLRKAGASIITSRVLRRLTRLNRFALLN